MPISGFTTSEVAADWHELMIPQRIMRSSIANASEQLDPAVQHAHIPSSTVINLALAAPDAVLISLCVLCGFAKTCVPKLVFCCTVASCVAAFWLSFVTAGLPLLQRER